MGKFGDEIRTFEIDFSKLSDQVFRIVTIKFFGQIVKASPVDTGRFRSNWFATGLKPSTRVDFDANLSTTAIDKRIINKINSLKRFTTKIFHLTNNLPYSETIEFGGFKDGPKTEGGFSKLAAGGVVRITAKSFSKIFNENAKKLNKL